MKSLQRNDFVTEWRQQLIRHKFWHPRFFLSRSDEGFYTNNIFVAYIHKNDQKYRKHKEKPEYVILEVKGDIFGNFICLFMKYEWPTPKNI